MGALPPALPPAPPSAPPQPPPPQHSAAPGSVPWEPSPSPPPSPPLSPPPQPPPQQHASDAWPVGARVSPPLGISPPHARDEPSSPPLGGSSPPPLGGSPHPRWVLGTRGGLNGGGEGNRELAAIGAGGGGIKADSSVRDSSVRVPKPLQAGWGASRRRGGHWRRSRSAAHRGRGGDCHRRRGGGCHRRRGGRGRHSRALALPKPRACSRRSGRGLPWMRGVPRGGWGPRGGAWLRRGAASCSRGSFAT